MDKFILYDGRAPLGSEHLREKKLADLILKLEPKAHVEKLTETEVLIARLEQSEPSVCLLHHSEILLAGLSLEHLPNQHFYIHYSGAGFESAPVEWCPHDQRMFVFESIDRQDEESMDPLQALIQTLLKISPAPNCGQWAPQLKTLALTPYKSVGNALVGHFPRWLAEAWSFKQGDLEPEREAFAQWALGQKLPDGSYPGPLTIESARKRLAQISRKDSEERSSSSLMAQLSAKIRHDLKYLLFALKDGDRERFEQLWKENFQPDLNHWLAHRHLKPSDIGMDEIDAWIETKGDDALKAKKLLLHLREQLEKPEADSLQRQQKTNFVFEKNIPVEKEESSSSLPSFHELPYEPNQHSPRLWCVGPRHSIAPQLKKCLKGLSAGHRPLNLSQCCYDEQHQLGDLLHQLRLTNPRELFHTLLMVDVGQHLREALNAGRTLHSLSAAASWTHDNQLQMGIVIRLICTFPHMGLMVFHDLPHHELVEILTEEFLYALPENGIQEHSFLEQLISQHFFNLKTDGPACAKVCAHFIEGQRQLFDPTGLRTLTKLRLIANIFSGRTDQGQPDLHHTEEQRKVLASRLEQVLISVDEDVSSTLFHAYAGYRYGYRAWTVTSFYQFDQAHIWESPARRRLVIRDTDLRFPDIDGREMMRDNKSTGSVRQRLESVHSDLWQWLPKGEDGKSKPKLDNHWRVRTVAAAGKRIRLHPWMGSSEDERRNGELRGSDGDQPYVLGLHKPLRSLYDLAQLMDVSGKENIRTVASRLTPPARLSTPSGHFAPYINLPLAGELLTQAKSLQGEDEMDWLIGAVLALEADEILLGMSEYTGLDAVRWLHRCEVRAEIRSVGFSGLIHIQPRKNELQSLVRARYHNNELSQDHFLSRLWDDLRMLYKGAEQFHASEEANIESFCKRKWLGHHHLLHVVEEAVRRIVILSASSISVWCLCLLSSTLLMWGLYCSVLPAEIAQDQTFGFQVFMSSLLGEPAFGMDAPFTKPFSAGLQAVLFLHYSISYLLFGFFLSMVYRRITRT